MEKYAIALDWLQLYCVRNQELTDVEFRESHKSYLFRLDGYETPMYKSMGHVYYEHMEIATVYWNPRSMAIPTNAVSIKMHNRVLYSDYWWEMATDVINGLALEYKGVTRIDICYDCNWLAGHRSVPSFLQDFVSHTALTPGHIIRRGSRRMTITASRDSMGASSISAIRWGSRSNDVGAYCYNKSLEMMEVKRKPWIEEWWMNAGLVNLRKGYEWDSLTDKEKKRAIDAGIVESEYIECPVWRFELSIKAHGKDLLNKYTGEIVPLSLNLLKDNEMIEAMFRAYAEKYFDFRINTGQSRIRDYERMRLFEVDVETELMPRRVLSDKETGKIERVVSNVIMRYRKTYCDLSAETKDALDRCLYFFSWVSRWRNERTQKEKYFESLKNLNASRRIHEEYYRYTLFCYRMEQAAEEMIPNPELIHRYWLSLESAIKEEMARQDALE